MEIKLPFGRKLASWPCSFKNDARISFSEHYSNELYKALIRKNEQHCQHMTVVKLQVTNQHMALMPSK